MSMISKLSAAVGTVLALWSATASAGLINRYDFDGPNGSAPSASFAGTQAGGPTVTVTAYLFDGSSWTPGRVSRADDALGALTGDSTTDPAPGQIGPRIEGLMFQLSSTVFGAFEIDFALFGGADNVDIWASTTDIIANGFAGATQVANDATSNPFTSGALSFRYIFVANTTSASSCTTASAECFRIDDLQVVPEPGSLALVGGGLLLAGLARRRRQAAD